MKRCMSSIILIFILLISGICNAGAFEGGHPDKMGDYMIFENMTFPKSVIISKYKFKPIMPDTFYYPLDFSKDSPMIKQSPMIALSVTSSLNDICLLSEKEKASRINIYLQRRVGGKWKSVAGFLHDHKKHGLHGNFKKIFKEYDGRDLKIDEDYRLFLRHTGRSDIYVTLEIIGEWAELPEITKTYFHKTKPLVQ